MIKLGNVQIAHDETGTVTTFADSSSVTAHHEEQPGQYKTAQDWGLTVDQMNRTHDLTHSLLANWLGLLASPTLQAVAHGKRDPNWWIEERAVLALQSFAAAAGVDLVSVAERQAAVIPQSIAKMIEALEWYAEQGANCRKITTEGETARNNLDRDGGKRAKDALK